MSYIHLKQQYYTQGPYKVTSIREEDMLVIKQWRNEQMDVLRQNHLLTDEDQLRYFSNVILPSFSNPTTRIILFSFFWNEELIGYGGLTNIDWMNKRAEISYLVKTDRSKEANIEQYKEDFSTFLRLMRRVAFNDLELNRLYTETFDIRPLHIKILENNGFLYEGRMKEHVLIDGRFIDSLLHGCIKGNFEHVEG
ncbi:GNAT family N-acetyltransferase [Paenibacillus motobuensis]|uniref:Ribosomal-protein-serine acetyltransferase n=1 Tax=Paenibacillus motobuensis TaxID=295324 RepID=A0ABN0XZI0_9BACL